VDLSHGAPTYTINEDVAWDCITWNETLEQLMHRADAICFGSLAQRNPISATTIRQALDTTSSSTLKVFDVNIRQHYCTQSILTASLPLADILKVSDEELPELVRLLDLTGDQTTVLRGLLKNYDLQSILLTRGAAGCRLVSQHEDISHPATSWGPVSDTVGCGDAFTAGFVVALLSGKSAQESLHHANSLAGFVSTMRGATPEIPSELMPLK